MKLPTHDYWPLNDGDYVDHRVLLVNGYFDPGSLQFAIDGPRPISPVNPIQRHTIVHLPTMQPSVARVNTLPGEPRPTATNVKMNTVLMEGLWEPKTGFKYIGEMNVQYPPQAQLALDVTPGPIIDGRSYVPFSQDGTTDPINYPWKYKTISRGVWDKYPDTVRTAHYEVNDKRIYNYVFARGIGLVDYWYGYVKPDNTVSGYQFYGIGYGTW